MAKRTAGLLSIVVLSLLAAGCGGGEAATTTVAADAASITATIAATLVPETGEGSPFDAASAQCAAEGVVAAIGPGRLAAVIAETGDPAGDPSVVFSQLTTDEMSLALAAAEGCIDLQTAVPAALASFGFSADVSACVGETLVAGGFGEPVIASYLAASDPTADAAFAAAYVDALTGPCAAATQQLMADDLISYYGISEAGAACVGEAFATSADFDQIVTAWMGISTDSIDTTAITDEITGVFRACLTPEELATLGVDTTSTTTSD